MEALQLFFIFLAIAVSGAIVYYQYMHGRKLSNIMKFPAFLRFVTLLSVFMLLINPGFRQKEFKIVKPELLLAIDNSSSIIYGGSEDSVRKILAEILSDKELENKFDIRRFNFGNSLSFDTLLHFKEDQTNIHKAIELLNEAGSQHTAPIVLLTDGNQTYGRSYRYVNSKQPVFPVILGDTVFSPDLEVSLVNVNAYATMGNNFPVEIFLNYSGAGALETRLHIERDKETIHSETIVFSEKTNSHRLEIFLPADSEGMQLYRVYLEPFDQEKNEVNNTYSFGVEMINEQTEVALIYGVLHPDLGMIKRSIESNKQRKVVLLSLEALKSTKKDFPIYILYQPEYDFKDIFEKLNAENSSYFLITGSHTDWRFLNNIQQAFSRELSEVTESYFPVFRGDFKTFYNEDIGFEGFSPLKDYFGSLSFKVPQETLLSQRIDGISTEEPLLCIYNEGNSRRVVLFGEDIWKWRLYSRNQDGSFDKFDHFFNGLIQYLQLSDKQKEMELIYQAVNYANQPVRVQVKNYDSNLNPELNSDLVLQFKDSAGTIPFFVRNNVYEIQLQDLKPGNYTFTVTDQTSNEKQAGSFAVIPFTMEQEKTSAHVKGLNELALNSKGSIFYPDQFGQLKQALMENPKFRSVEKESIKMISLIDWKWLLGLIVLSLSLEWLIRKYKGMI